MYTTSYQETKKQEKEKRINNSNLEKKKLKFAIELYGYPAASNRIRLPIDRT